MDNGTRPEPAPASAVRRAAFLPQAGEFKKEELRIMKKLFTLLALCALLPLAVFAAGSTEQGQSLKDGYHIGGKTTDRITFYDGTPIAQQAASVTAYGALKALHLIAQGTDYSIQHATVALTAANLNGMYAAPVQILAAPGAGKSIVITKLVFTITRTATAFANGAAAIVQYGSTVHGGGTQALDSTLASTVLTGSAGTTVSARNGAVISDLAAATIQNAGVYISNGTAAFDTGTGTAVADVWYVVQ